MNKLFLKQLNEIYSNDLFTDPADCWVYAYDNGRHQALPGAVARVSHEQQVIATLKVCVEHRIPVVARGRGTGTPGGAIPSPNGLVLSFEKMNRILEIDANNRYICVEPGVTNQAVQQAALAHGFFWPPDPSSQAYCTIGGNLAYNSAGPRAIKYGTPRENTLGLRAVTGTGATIFTGGYTTKGATGYDLTRLLIGSEGTLAIITQAILKLTPLAASRCTLQAVYTSYETATEAITRIMAQPLTPCALEFLDQAAITLLRQQGSHDFPPQAKAILLIEIDGADESISHAVQSIQDAAQTTGLIALRTANNEQDAQQLWQARKALSPALRTLAPYKINEDVVVPVSAIPNLLSGLSKLSEIYTIPIVNFGHAGNGNLHVNLLLDTLDAKLQEKALACLDKIFDLVIQLKGTLSGEHGIGIEKRAYLPRAIDANSLALMRGIKSVFDPHGILNPDKIFFLTQ